MRRAVRRIVQLGLIGGISYLAWRTIGARQATDGGDRTSGAGAEAGGTLRLVQGLRAEGNSVGVEVDIETPAPTDDRREIPDPAWVAPDDDGSCPSGFTVKAKLTSGIFHVPDGTNYDRTKADRCYASVEAAELDGLRPPKR